VTYPLLNFYESSREAIEDLEAQVPQNKEQLKPLAKPMKSAEEL